METKRCSLKITSRTDYIDLVKLYNDTKVWDYLGGQRSSQEIENRIAEWINPKENCQYWTVREIVSGAFLGCILLTPHYDGEYTQISYMFLSSFWGNGFAFEAVSQVLCHSFENKRYNLLIAEAQSANTSSCTLLKKLGFYEVERVNRFNAEQIIFAIDHPYLEHDYHHLNQIREKLKKRTFKIGTIEEYTPQIGHLVSMMNYARFTTLNTVKGLTVEQLDYLPNKDGNSIGALLLHMAAIELGFQIGHFDKRKPNKQESEEWGAAYQLGELGRKQIKGNPLEIYIEKLERIRNRTLNEFKKRTDEWLYEETGVLR